jgi:putative addiction module component (TIGR02574 family)
MIRAAQRGKRLSSIPAAPLFPARSRRYDSFMADLVELDKLSVAQKLQLMEAIWDDLCRSGREIHSPEWHRQVLEARQRRADQDPSLFSDWNQARQRIRDSLP